MGELVSMAEQFGGLPMDQLIGSPLKAACDAQVTLAAATSDFITNVGFENDKVRMVDFGFTKPENIGGKITNTDYKVSIPFISIVSVPTLQVTEVDVNFMMEVKSSFSENTSEKKDASVDTAVEAKFGPVSVSVKAHGSISSSKETQRQSDNSAKYDVSVKARQSGTPEGLSRVLDILQQCIVPIKADDATAQGTV
ncbi:uncharacterized protein DUF2589 [Sinobacterium caligoides]|uniref:Uncharacterized protein DUF2589 n=1 Tax=Sinobacterium caligoides TaxID=933926 RepID=A0A3N2DZH0_9GAMM|nr:DUF2589 domain-containing protein [Sinobacterium caligoides]ROS05224.1 uncharacterized protein DUF2589 [Sinobacterium caligoides]